MGERRNTSVGVGGAVSAAHVRSSGFRSQYPHVKSCMIIGTRDPSPVGNRDRRMAWAHWPKTLSQRNQAERLIKQDTQCPPLGSEYACRHVYTDHVHKVQVLLYQL